MSKTKNFDHPC